MVKVAFVGLGAMGLRMANRLAQADEVELSGYDVDPARVQALPDGVRRASSIADAVAGADAIFSVVPADVHVRAVLDELVPAVAEGQTYVDFSTIGPATIAAAEERLAAVGARTISAGMTKSIEGATNGTLSLFIGGVDEVPAKLTPAFDAIATELMPVGNVGAAKAMKLVNNMVVASLDCAITEALALAAQHGVPFESVTDALAGEGAESWPLQHHIVAHVLPDDLGPGFFSTRLLIKDMRLYTDFAAGLGMPAAFAGLATSFYRGTSAIGLAEDYHMIVVRWFERGANLGGREPTPLPAGADDFLRRLSAGVAAVQVLLSAEALRVLGRMGIAATDAAHFLEHGSAGNDSLREMVRLAAEGREGVTARTLVEDLGAVLDLAHAANFPATLFETARHLALEQVDRYGEEADLWHAAVGEPVAGS